MTLIEMLIVLLIAATLMGLATVSVRNITNADLNGAALRLANTITFIYGRAAINGMRYQLVLDLDENRYSAECSEAEVALPDELISASFVGDESEERHRYEDDDEEADPFGLNLDQLFDDCSEPLIPVRTLRDGVVFDSVMTSHQTEPFEEGQTTIAFFPNGFVEQSIIWLKEADGDAAITLLDNPMNGRVRIESGHVEMSEDFHEVEEDR